MSKKDKSKKINLEKKIERLTEIFVIDEEKGIKASISRIPFKYVTFHAINPNKMDDKTFSALQKNVAKGYLEFSVVWWNKKDNVFQCIDGEHRLRALELNGETMPIVTLIEDGLTEAAAFTGAYTFNKIKGAIDPKQTAKMLQFGVEHYGEKKMQKLMQMQKYQMDEHLLFISNQTDATSNEAEDARKKVLENIDQSMFANRNQKPKFESISQQELLASDVDDNMDLTMIISGRKPKIDYINKILPLVDSDKATAVYLLCKAHSKRIKVRAEKSKKNK